MTTLLRKELRALLPFAAIVLGVEALGAAYTLATELPDRHSFSPNHYDSTITYGVLVFSLMVGSSLLVRESEEGTLHFLDALPVSRSRVFLAKMLAGVLVLSGVPLIEISFECLLGWMSLTSTDSPLPWGFIGVSLGVGFLVAASALATAAALSLLRHWFALAAGLLFLGAAWLRARGFAWAELLNPEESLPYLDGASYTVPWKHIGTQAAIFAVAAPIAWLGFRRMGTHSRDAMEFFLSGSRWRRYLLGFGRLLTPIAWITAIVLLARSADDSSSDGAGTAPGKDEAYATHETKHYEFLYRKSQEPVAKGMISHADGVWQSVRPFFGELNLEDRMVVDLASPVGPHFAGMTNWTKIRLPVKRSMQAGEFKRILAHESAHVAIHRLAGPPFQRAAASTRFFNEGMATYVEERLLPADPRDHSIEAVAAAATARGRIPFALLCDNGELSRQRDPDLAYPLGCLFCEALVQTCGPEAPARILAEFSRNRSLLALNGVELWGDVLQRAGFSLERVIAAYEGKLDEAAKAQAAFVERLPRLTATATTKGEEVLITPRFDGEAPGRMICWIEESGRPLASSLARPLQSDGAFHIPRAEIGERRIRYMLGWAVKGVRFPVFEPWVEASL